MRIIPTWHHFLPVVRGLVDYNELHQAWRPGTTSTCASVWRDRRQMGVAEGVHLESACHHLGEPAVHAQRQPRVTTAPLPLHTMLIMRALLLLCFPIYSTLKSALPCMYFTHHCLSLSECSSLVRAFPVPPPEPAIYSLNPAAFVCTRLFLFWYSVCLNQRSGLAKCHYSPLIHFNLMPVYIIHR